MSLFVRRLVPLAFLAALVLVTVPPVAATSDSTLAAAESRMAGLLNDQRAAVGLPALKVDSRLTAVAEARSQDMIDKNYFAHQQPDGLYAWDLLDRAGIKWAYAGEIIGKTTGITLDGSTSAVASSWHASSTHNAIVTSPLYDEFGVGVATDGAGKYVWTGVFIKSKSSTSSSGGSSGGSGSKSSTSPRATTTSKAKPAAIPRPALTEPVVARWLGFDIRIR